MVFKGFYLLCWLAVILIPPGLRAETAPNIVFVLLDDLDKTITEPLFPEVMPRILKLGDEGITFENMHVSTPLCCPSRAAILSGKYAHETNVFNNGGPYGGRGQFIDDEPYALPVYLERSGYRTAMIGKYMNGFHVEKGKLPSIPPGWTSGSVFVDPALAKYRGYRYKMMSWVGESKELEYYGSGEEDYSTDVVLTKTLEFFEESKRNYDEQPFFAFVNPTCPHFPLPPAPRHREQAADLFRNHPFPSHRPNYMRAEISQNLDSLSPPKSRPRWLRHSWRKRLRLRSRGGLPFVWMGGEAPSERRPIDMGWHEIDWYNRLGSMLACDELVGSLVDWLKYNNEWDHTLFVFTSDNGYNLGAHGLAQKMAPYDEAARVPMIMAGGSMLGLRRREVEKAWVTNVDLAPTLLDFAGIRPPDDMDGHSMAPFLKWGRRFPEDFRKSLLFEYIGSGLANGYLYGFKWLHYRLMPAYFLDIPSYRALRIKKEFDGVERSFLFVEWERFPKRLLNHGRVHDYELFDLERDPFQMKNLLYYEKSRYASWIPEMVRELDRFYAVVPGPLR